MEAMNCPRCGKVFVKIIESICDACVKAEVNIFDKVRDYVKENPNKSIKEVSEECEVTVKRVLQYIRDGRLEASGGMQGDVLCSKCGKPINIGRMCEKCILETNFAINDMKNATKIKGRVFTQRRT
ncbi:MAG: flagellar protein [Defluviitaleaceae bacterium]|nr:flagellar protein [Defluviitaleaceae bacterium]